MKCLEVSGTQQLLETTEMNKNKPRQELFITLTRPIVQEGHKGVHNGYG